MNKADYDATVPDELRKYTGRHHYTWAVRHTIAQVVAWRFALRVQFPLEYIFDYMKPGLPSRVEIETVMQQGERVAIENGKAGEYTNFSFRRRQDHPGLQCVDCVAWTCFKLGQQAFHRNPMPHLANIAWNDFESRNKRNSSAGPLQWITAATVTRDNLKKWMNMEMGDGMTIARFQRWEQEDKS